MICIHGEGNFVVVLWFLSIIFPSTSMPVRILMSKFLLLPWIFLSGSATLTRTFFFFSFSASFALQRAQYERVRNMSACVQSGPGRVACAQARQVQGKS